MRTILILSFLAICIASCSTANKANDQNEKAEIEPRVMSVADQIISRAVKAHGGDNYNTAHYTFLFRGKEYTFKNDNDQYKYTLSSKKDGNIIEHTLTNGNFTRKVNGKEEELSEKKINGYSQGLNSVIYFATLPYKLQDEAVYEEYIDQATIKGKRYHVIEVTFREEGGGQDHDDTFYYWINQETNLIDYLAYNYKVGKGGVRFRTAYDTRNVDGIVFQNYVNYKAEVGTPLADLPNLWEKGALKELSKIETEEVRRM